MRIEQNLLTKLSFERRGKSLERHSMNRSVRYDEQTFLRFQPVSSVSQKETSQAPSHGLRVLGAACNLALRNQVVILIASLLQHRATWQDKNLKIRVRKQKKEASPPTEEELQHRGVSIEEVLGLTDCHWLWSSGRR